MHAFLPPHLRARSRAKSCGRSNIAGNGAAAAAFRIFCARRTSVIHVFPRSRILFLDQPWLAPPAWSRQRRIETPSCDQPRGAFLNRVSECDRHFSSCNVVLVANRLLQDATLSFRILFPFTGNKVSSRVQNEKLCCRFPSFLSDQRYNCSSLIQNVEPHAHAHPSVQKSENK